MQHMGIVIIVIILIIVISYLDHSYVVFFTLPFFVGGTFYWLHLAVQALGPLGLGIHILQIRQGQGFAWGRFSLTNDFFGGLRNPEGWRIQ
jgi:hypothetical protein